MDPTTIDPKEIDNELDRQGYIVIKDSEIEQTSLNVRREYEHCLQVCETHAPRERFHYSTLSKGPWRKLAIGSSNGVGEPYAQNLQTTYFDANDKNYPAIRSLFQMTIAVRNRLMGVEPSFGGDPERDRFWNACRIHHYPRGGGFMMPHKDTYFPQVIDAQIGKPFYQVCVLLSRKSTDFFSGGGFVVDNQKEKIDLEARGGFGALVIFDGRTYHGVDDVDLDQVIDFSRSDGRIAAFANLYSVV
jgi:hypothetical protein